MKSSSRWLQLWLKAMILACLALGLVAGTASARLSMDTSTDTEVTIDEDHHWFVNSLRPISYGGYQYIAYWDNEDAIDGLIYLVLTRRRLSDGNTVNVRFDTAPYEAYLEANTLDGHNWVGLGLSPNDGRIHIVWSLHTSDRRMRYWYSDTGCMERTQEEFTATDCGFDPETNFRTYMVEARGGEERITYPLFINDQRDRLWFTQRADASSRGDQYLNFYDESTHAWTLVGKIIRGRITGREAAGQETRREEANERANEYSFTIGAARYRAVERGVYIDGIAFDKNEVLHVAWAYRDHVAGYSSQHGINYSYSRDGGRTWYIRSAERDVRIATTETEPIDINDRTSTQVVMSEPGWLPSPPTMSLDSDNNPHFFNAESDTQVEEDGQILEEANLRQVHYWRNTEGTWYGQFVEPREDGVLSPSAGGMFLDRADNVYAIFARPATGWIPWNDESPSYSYHELWPSSVTWQENGPEDGILYIDLDSEITCIDTSTFVNAAIETRGNNQIRMRMRNVTTETDLIASWTTQESREWSAARQQRFTRVLNANDRAYTEYTFTVTDADWAGTLRELELCTAEGPTTGSQRIDWIKVTNSAGTAVYNEEFTTGFTLYGAEAAADRNWNTWNIEELLPGVALSAQDSYWTIDKQRYKNEKVVDFQAMHQGEPNLEPLVLHEFDITGDDIAKDWRFETDTIGWRGTNVTSLAWAEESGRKVLSGSLDRRSSDPQLLSMENLKIPLGSTTEDNVHVVLRNATRARRAKLYFITDADRTWNETKSIEFAITAESGYTTYNIDMSRVSGWRSNTLYQLRLDPTNETAREGSFKIDRIYIEDN